MGCMVLFSYHKSDPPYLLTNPRPLSIVQTTLFLQLIVGLHYRVIFNKIRKTKKVYLNGMSTRLKNTY